MHQFAGLAPRQQMAVIIHDGGLVHDQGFAPVIAETLELPVRLRHRGGRIHFGLAAGQHKIGAHVRDRALQQRTAHRRHGVDAGLQAGQVVFPAARMIEDGLIHQRQADKDRQLVAHDGFHARHRIEAAHQCHASADRQIAQQQHMTRAVEQRKLPGNAVVAIQMHLDGVAHHRHHHREMTMHRALRPRRRAAGIDDHRQIAVVEVDLGLDLRLAFQQIVEILKARRGGRAGQIDRDQIDAALLQRRAPIGLAHADCRRSARSALPHDRGCNPYPRGRAWC